MRLYKYQQDMVEIVIDEFAFHKSVMIQMPTGTGKTNVFCEIINRLNKRALILVHTRELVEQAKERLHEFKIDSGIIMSGYDIHPHLDIQIASIQTLVRRPYSAWPNNISLIVIDEAHHATAKSYQKILKKYNNDEIKILGVTATPCRMNNVGFGGIFNKLISSKSISEFIRNNELVGFKHFATTTPDLSAVKYNKQLSDYDNDELAIAMSRKTIMSDIIESYKTYGNNRRCILFAVNQSHSKLIVKRFINEGINAEYIDSNTKKSERKNILDRFRTGEIQVLVNVKIFTEGFDCPDISVVQLVRPTKSFALYMQMVGRSLRKQIGKNHAIIIDNAGLWKTHGLITKDIKWSLGGLTTFNRSVAVKSQVNGEIYEAPFDKIKEIKGLEMQEIDELLPNNISRAESIYLKFKTFENRTIDITINHSESDSVLEFLTNVLDKILKYLFTSDIQIFGINAKVESNYYEFQLGDVLKMKSDFYDIKTGFVAFYIDIAFKNIRSIKNYNIVKNQFLNKSLIASKSIDDFKINFFKML